MVRCVGVSVRAGDVEGEEGGGVKEDKEETSLRRGLQMLTPCLESVGRGVSQDFMCVSHSHT